jgi:hypothetical protein
MSTTQTMMMVWDKDHSLVIGPVQAGRAKQRTGTFVVVPTVHFHISGQLGIESLTFWGDPVENGSLQTLSVIGSGT